MGYPSEQEQDIIRLDITASGSADRTEALKPGTGTADAAICIDLHDVFFEISDRAKQDTITNTVRALLYMPDYKNEPAGVETIMPWSGFIKESCCGVMDTETETPENRGRIPLG